MNTLPVFALIGLTTSGKTTVARIMEEKGDIKQVRRLVTRPIRSDDNPDLVTSVPRLFPGPGDLVFGGWGEEAYCIPSANIEEIRLLGKCPCVELGEFRVAETLRGLYSPAYVILVEREIDERRIRAVCRKRGMSDAEIAGRILWLWEDADELLRNRGRVDFVIQNDGSLEELETKVQAVIRKLAV